MKILIASAAIFFFSYGLSMASVEFTIESASFVTDASLGTISTTRGGRPVTISAIVGYRFKATARDTITGRTRTFNGVIKIPTKNTVPPWGEVKGKILAYANKSKFRTRANASFNLPLDQTENIDVDGIIVIDDRGINPDD